ncbi:MAG: HlyD family efflux transporter periplasmic adaptor subunit [bacterium]|nr:HlyD family efflux transporter periplasmic adaptor subunit [bacterium]
MNKFLFLIMIVIIGFAGCGGEKDTTTAVTVQKGRFEVVIPAFGELQAVTSTPISVPTRARGRQTIAWMAAENSFVKEGETVVRMDASYYTERMQRENYSISTLNLEIGEKENVLDKEKMELQGQLVVAGIERQLAEVYGARDENIFSRNEIIEDAINLEYLTRKTEHLHRKKTQLEEKSQAELQLLNLKRKTHRVRFDQYKGGLDSLELKAPHDGLFIYEKNWRGEKPRVGKTVWRGTKLGKLPDLSQMEAKVYVLESEAAGLKEGLAVSVSLDAAPGKVFAGKVKGIDTIAKPLEREGQLKYFEVKVSLEKTDKAIMKPGSQVKAVVFVQDLADVISVPNQALFFKEEQAYINIMKGGGVQKLEVKTGARSLTRTVITEGLTVGENVVLGNPLREDKSS